MSSIQIIEERREPLPVQNEDKVLPFYRWEKRAILGYRGRRFLVFMDNLTSATYIEEITTGDLKYIEDELLHQELSLFAQTKGFLDMMLPLQKGNYL